MTIIGAIWRWSIPGRICSGEGPEHADYGFEAVNYAIAGGLVIRIMVIINFVGMGLIIFCGCCCICKGELMMQYAGVR